jgi:hypothetical protein
MFQWSSWITKKPRQTEMSAAADRPWPSRGEPVTLGSGKV